MSRSLKQFEIKERAQRRNRDSSMGGFTKRLAMPKHLVDNPNYNFRWFNDDGTRLSVAMANDYDFADEDGGEVDKRSDSRHKVHVGSLPDGTPQYAYLMRIRKDWQEKRKQEVQDGTDEKMKQIQQTAESDPARPSNLRHKGAIKGIS